MKKRLDEKKIGSGVSTFEAWILYLNLQICAKRSAKPTKSKSDLSIPCLIKQLKQPKVKGIIKQYSGDRVLRE